jgi:hypothetical protein
MAIVAFVLIVGVLIGLAWAERIKTQNRQSYFEKRLAQIEEKIYKDVDV